MNKDEFKKNITGFAKVRGLKLEPEYVKFIYDNLLNKVNDESFRNACGKISFLGNEEYFNKYKGKLPAINDWLEVCGYRELTDDDIMVRAKNVFIEKCIDYIDIECPVIMYPDFNKNLTENEVQALNMSGGISALWSSHRNGDYSRNLNTITKELSVNFMDSYKQERNEKMIEQSAEVKKLVSGLFKMD